MKITKQIDKLKESIELLELRFDDINILLYDVIGSENFSDDEIGEYEEFLETAEWECRACQAKSKSSIKPKHHKNCSVKAFEDLLE